MEQKVVEGRLQRVGYQPMHADSLPFGLWFREDEKEVYAAAVVGSPELFRKAPLEFQAVLEQVQKALSRQFNTQARLIALVLTEDPGQDRVLSMGAMPVWFLGSDGGLIIFDHEPGTFDGLESALTREDHPIRDVLSLGGMMPWLTIALIAVNVLIQLVISLQNAFGGGSFLDPSGPSALLALFELPVRPFVEGHLQIYRLLTAAFTHYGWQHLFNNMLVLLFLGRATEKYAGKVPYILGYLLCAVGGNLVSLFWYRQAGAYMVTTAGASGAVFGLAGMLLVWVILHRGRLYQISTRQLVIMIALTVFHGVSENGINNAAHIGGACIGAAVGLVIAMLKKADRGRKTKPVD